MYWDAIVTLYNPEDNRYNVIEVKIEMVRRRVEEPRRIFDLAEILKHIPSCKTHSFAYLVLIQNLIRADQLILFLTPISWGGNQVEIVCTQGMVGLHVAVSPYL